MDVAGVVCLLVAVTSGASFEYVRGTARFLGPAALLVIAFALPDVGCATLPVAAYDLATTGDERGDMPLTALWAIRLAWVIPLAVAARTPGSAGTSLIVGIGLACLAATLLSRRTKTTLVQDGELHVLRDSLQEKIIQLDTKNQELVQASDEIIHGAALMERARIARDIHDNVGHLLTRAALQAEAFQVIHAQEPVIADEFSQVGATVHEALDSVRDSVHALRDESIDLATKLNQLARNSSVDDTVVEITADDAVPAEVAACFTAVCKEALTNAARHGHATQAHVRVTEYPALWQLVVSDDGDVSTLSDVDQDTLLDRLAAHGMGLRSMQERIEALAGTFRVSRRSGDDHGFTVFASIPRRNA
jgi:signal transduction histidine kinase